MADIYDEIREKQIKESAVALAGTPDDEIKEDWKVRMAYHKWYRDILEAEMKKRGLLPEEVKTT